MNVVMRFTQLKPGPDSEYVSSRQPEDVQRMILEKEHSWAESASQIGRLPTMPLMDIRPCGCHALSMTWVWPSGLAMVVLGLKVPIEITGYTSPSPLFPVLFSSILFSLYTCTSLEHLNTMGWPVCALSFYPFRNKSCTQEQWCCWNINGSKWFLVHIIFEKVTDAQVSDVGVYARRH